MTGMLSKCFIILILIIYPSITIFSLFGLLPFFPLNFFVMGVGVCVILSLMVKACYKIRTQISLTDYLIIISFLWFFVMILLHINLYSYTEDGRYISAIRYYSPFFISSLCCYFAFKHGVSFFITPVCKYFLLVMYASLTVITVLYFDIKTFKIDFSQLIDSSYIGVYQIVSDSLAFTILCVLSLTRMSKPVKIILIVFTLFLLLILNARSGLIGFILGLLFILNIKRTLKHYPIIAFFSCFLIIISIVSITPDLAAVSSFFENSNSRIYNIFSGNFSDDASFVGRMKLLLHSFTVIMDYPFFGNFGSQAASDIDGFGIRWGAYTHNIFVYWDQFGIVGFILVISLIVISVYNNIKLKNNFNIDLSAVIVLVISQQVFLKSFTYFYLFAIIGLIEGVKYVSEYNHNHKKL